MQIFNDADKIMTTYRLIFEIQRASLPTSAFGTAFAFAVWRLTNNTHKAIGMNRQEILDLLLKDSSHDSLIERPELYSIEGDIYQWMFDERDYWNERLSRFCKIHREEGEKLQREEPE